VRDGTNEDRRVRGWRRSEAVGKAGGGGLLEERWRLACSRLKTEAVERG
jgi:hypothetical protein